MAIRKRTVAGFVALVAVVGGVVAAWGYASQRWGCPSYAEANRPRTTDEVTRAFRGNGIPVSRARQQRLARATVFQHTEAAATVWVIVCITNRCAPRFERVIPSERPVRRGVSFLNVRVWLASSNSRSARSLLARVDSAASDLSPSSNDKRCFPD